MVLHPGRDADRTQTRLDVDGAAAVEMNEVQGAEVDVAAQAFVNEFFDVPFVFCQHDGNDHLPSFTRPKDLLAALLLREVAVIFSPLVPAITCDNRDKRV